jgi:hypothetical protein
LVATAVALTVALIVAGVALASVRDGGRSVSGAPALSIGTAVTGGDQVDELCCDSWYQQAGSPGLQYWKVLLQFGDHLVIDYGVVSGDNVNLCMLAPTVTDFTLTDSRCTASDSTQSKHEFTFTASTAGTWTLAVGYYHCCGMQSWAYQMTAYVKHPTQAKITAPPLIKHGSRITYSGTVAGASGGVVELQSRSSARPVWKSFGVASLSTTGAFKFQTRVATSGTYRVKVVYPGDASHLPSTGIVSFKVI